jgi:hypothetical protein
MCFNCGCGNPNDDMGSSDNITNETFKKLADAEGKSVEDVKKSVLAALQSNTASVEVKQMLEKAANAWGQSYDEAKKETMHMLSHELHVDHQH